MAKAAGLIALAALLAYHNCFTVPFAFDDIPTILDNATIRHLWPLSGSFSWPPGDTTVGNRPVANFTLAINYALGGYAIWGYHALNLLIHILGGLTLFGIVRRTMTRPVLAARFGRDAVPLAFAVALLWTLHPLQTESVTYVVQRVESLMGLLYLLTLYCFVRSVDSSRRIAWLIGSVAACLTGMATKEVMVTAPVMVFLYDRTFVAGTFRKAWQLRRVLYCGFAATWVPLVMLVSGTNWNRGGSTGFHAGVAPGDYWLTQLEAVARYAGLSFWPSPLVFDYGPFRARSLGDMAPYALVVVPLAAATLFALWRKPVLGFLGAWFFVILSPSSVIPIATQTMAEHRMYLPLAAVVLFVVSGVYAVAGRRCWGILGAMALVLAFLTGSRNEDYQSESTLWGDTVAKRPDNANARNNFGLALFRTGQTTEAIEQYEAALRIQPAYPGALSNLGNALDRAGRTPEAILQYEKALGLQPDFAAAHYNLGKALARSGRISEAIDQYGEALRLRPDYSDGHVELGDALAQSDKVPEAIEQYMIALRIKPDSARAHFGVANAMVQSGRLPEAIENYEAALRDQPDLAEASTNLGIVLCRSGRVPEGMQRLDAAIQMQPEYAPAHFARATALLQGGRKADAAAEYRVVLQLRPNDPSALRMLESIQTSP